MASEIDFDKIYDYVVVGGGTAGLVIANRLSENADVQVLVLEAGKNHNDDRRVTVPALYPILMDDPEVDWTFITEPQEHLNGRRIGHPRGRLLGGSSAINAQALIYPSKASVDSSCMLVYKAWSWDVMVEYYRKFQTLTPPTQAVRDALCLDYVSDQLQGTNGPIQVSFPFMDGPLQKAWVDTFRNLKSHMTTDPFSGQAIGGFSNPCSIDNSNKSRSHSGNAYYAPVSGRLNLHLATETYVEKILFEKIGDTHRAIGVQCIQQESRRIIRADSEVVLSAGVFQTPQILELSGIGGADLLSHYGVKTIIDNKFVGENLQDHPMTSISFEVNEGVMTGEMMRDPNVVQAVSEMYDNSRSGPLCVGGLGSYALLPLALTSEDGNEQQIKKLLDEYLHKIEQKVTYPAQKLHTLAIRRLIESQADASASIFMAPQQGNFDKGPSPRDIFRMAIPGNFISIGVSLQHPLSRGSVHIQSPDILIKPVVDPEYLSHPLDIEIYARHMLLLEVIVQTEPLASFLKPDGRRNSKTAYMKDIVAAKNYLKQTVASNWHPVGTCAMMPKEVGGVVDERLIVHGTTNLRVVDASVFALVPKGNIQSSVYAVAERAADLIKDDRAASKKSAYEKQNV